MVEDDSLRDLRFDGWVAEEAEEPLLLISVGSPDCLDLGRGPGTLSRPTDLELAQMMGGNKYESEPDGRYPFRVTVNGRSHLVEMPALPLDAVRFLGGAGQNIWDFPRLFVDGSSWVWKYALHELQEEQS